MKLSWFNISMGAHKLYLTNEYVQYKAMQDIREIELRDSGSNTNNMICFEIWATALRPHLHAEGFSLCPHRTFHKGTSTEELQLYTWSTLLFSQTQSPLHKRDRHKAKTQSPLHKRDRHKAKAQTQSPLHKRDRHNAKAKKRLQSWWSNNHK